MLASARHARRFRRALHDPRRAQEKILLDFLRRNARSAYGRKHGYEGIRTVEEFQEAVPLAAHDDLEPWIDRARAGETGVLTEEPVLLFEKTSGSSGPAKYIPYTASFLAELQRAVGAWMFDLYSRRPSLRGGSQYWCVTPLAREKEKTPGGLPVGLDDDTEVLGLVARRLLGRVMAVPGRLARRGDLAAARRRIVRRLARRRDLRLISVWSPSFLLLLLDELPPGARPEDIWPDLELISCWTGGASARYLPELRARFPGVEIQGKGLLATEGVVSFPLAGRPAPVPAIASHFLEFIGDDGAPRLAGELEVGRRYAVAITTGGGLARYRLGDEVEAVAPDAIEFTGRRGEVSDLCGEKLSEGFVGTVIEAAAARFGLAGFAMLAPEWDSPPRYLLFVDAGRTPEIASFVDERLRASVHYDYCRRLGQLGPVAGVRVPDAAARYLSAAAELGQRAGGVKPAYLRRELDWRERMGSHARA
jgi:hypothetical protein